MKICIDAGHGGKDPGALGGTRQEKDDTLQMALRLKKVLLANGIEVAMTREDDHYDSPSQKAAIGNKSKCDFFVSLHRNAGSASANGFEVEVYSKSGKKYEAAQDLCKRAEKRGFKNRGVNVRTDLAVLRGTKMQAMLVEMGFITNRNDNEIYVDNFYPLVNDIARSIMGAYGLKFRTLTEIKEGK